MNASARDLAAESRCLRRTGDFGPIGDDSTIGDLLGALVRQGEHHRGGEPPALVFALASLEALGEELYMLSEAVEGEGRSATCLPSYVEALSTRARVASELARRMGQHENAATRVARVPSPPSPPWTGQTADRLAFVAGRLEAHASELRSNPTAAELVHMADELSTLQARVSVMAADAAREAQTGAQTGA